jgi:hypothetical protein
LTVKKTYNPEDYTDLKLHPEVRKFYNNTGLEYELPAFHAAHEVMARQAAGQPCTERIDAIYRVRAGSFSNESENIWYYLSVKSQDEYGNPVFAPPFVVGRYERPEGSYQYDIISKRKKVTGIDSTETTYDIPFSKERLDELAKSGLVDGKTRLYVDTGDIKYNVATFEDFKNLSFEDLVHIGRTGLRPGEQQAIKRAVK